MQISSVDITKDNRELVMNATDEAIEAAFEAIGMQAEAYAKSLCPVDTGNLRNSITHAVNKSEKAVYIGTNVEYAPYVEMGTSRNKAQPYLKPAAENHTNEYKSIMEEQIERVMGK